MEIGKGPRVAEASWFGYIQGMTHPNGDLPPRDELPRVPDWPSHPAIEPKERRNLILLALHQIVFRVGWIFKTESVIIPAFLDHVAGAGWIRGCLPVLNRLGQSVPPVFLAGRLRTMRQKKWALAACTAFMSVPFLALAVVWFSIGGARRPWMSALFLALYLAFFVWYGLYLVSFGTVQGKLIRPTRRGHLLLVSTFWGAIPASLMAIWLMPNWLSSPFPGWVFVFAFIGGCCLVSGMTAMLLSEPADDGPEHRTKQRGCLADTVRVLRQDRNLRRLVLVGVLFASGLIIFPHYQAMARQRMGFPTANLVHLVPWVVAQNIAVAVFSLFVGPLADRRGYRLTLRLLIFGSAVAPAVAVLLARLPSGVGANLFWMVFVALGVTPLVLRTLSNYALEICGPQEHPRYLSIVSLGVALPFLFSPAVGWLVDLIGFERVFVSAIIMIVLSGCLTFRLEEPRLRHREDQAWDAGVGPPD